MKALYKAAAAPGWTCSTCPSRTVGAGDVKIRVRRAGICGTDLHIEAWDDWAAGGGERAAGRRATSSAVTSSRSAAAVRDVRVGDQVSGEGHMVCGTCRNCRAGRRHLCIRTQGIGVNRDGAFAEFVVLPESNVWVHQTRDRLRPGRHLRPVRQRRAHRAELPAGGGGRAHHRRRPDRSDRRRGVPPRRRAVRRHHRRQPVRAWNWPGSWASTWPSTCQPGDDRRRAARASACARGSTSAWR